MKVCCIRGQGVRVGNRFGVVHRYVSPSEVLVKFRDGFETVPVDQLLPATEMKLESLPRKSEEYRLKIELTNPLDSLDNKMVPEVWAEEEAAMAEEEF